MKKQVGIRMDEETITELRRLAGLDRRDFAEYCRIVLEDHVKAKRQAAQK